MKYFIDFEATQYGSEIISVGCVDENRRQFYTCVQPHCRGMLTGFITDLTGITKADLEGSPNADEAFERLYDWIDTSAPVVFYCYGNCDRQFAHSTIKYLHSFKAQCMLSLIEANIVDYTSEIKRRFGLKCEVSLIKVISYYRGEEISQKHDSLEDALFLKEIYDHREDPAPEECPFPDYAAKQAPGDTPFTPRVFAYKNGHKYPFRSVGSAADWVIKNFMSDRNVSSRTKSNVSNRIVLAAENKRTYFGCEWKLNRRKKSDSAAKNTATS